MSATRIDWVGRGSKLISDDCVGLDGSTLELQEFWNVVVEIWDMEVVPGAEKLEPDRGDKLSMSIGRVGPGDKGEGSFQR